MVPLSLLSFSVADCLNAHPPGWAFPYSNHIVGGQVLCLSALLCSAALDAQTIRQEPEPFRATAWSQRRHTEKACGFLAQLCLEHLNSILFSKDTPRSPKRKGNTARSGPVDSIRADPDSREQMPSRFGSQPSF